MTWQAFVLEYGRSVRAAHLAAIVGQPADAIERLRRSAPAKSGPRRSFAELFAIRHGRPPADEDWPRPTKAGGSGYEWLGPERALLASLVGRMSTSEISRILTERLGQVTGDPTATRDRNAVLIGLQRIGLQTSDVVGGLTVGEAAREIGARAILYHEIRTGKLPHFKVGRHLVIPHEAFAAWKAQRVFAPAGFIRLARLKKPLGIKSDKLSEWARAGYVPSAIRCTPYGTSEMSTRWGTWYIDPKIARKLIADRRAGRPMPWWQKPEPYNLQVTWRNWQRRKHPDDCATCRDIWGPAGAPATFEEYAQQYPPLAHGAKRHLTRVWTPGLTVAALAHELGISQSGVSRAIQNGALRAQRHQGCLYITRTDATRWKARRCPSGGSFRSWMAVSTACKVYGFDRAQVIDYIKADRLHSKTADKGAMRDVVYVLKQQMRELRDEIGFSAREAAMRVGVSIARLRVLLRGLEWRSADRIPADVVNAAIKREESREGVPLAEAARILGKPVSWIRQEIQAGTIRPLRTRWDKKRLYVSMPMFRRLCEAAMRPRPRQRWTSEWLLLSDAATLAGVSPTQVIRWSVDGAVVRRRHPDTYWRYHGRSLQSRARQYWATCRFKRATPPAWFTQEAA